MKSILSVSNVEGFINSQEVVKGQLFENTFKCLINLGFFKAVDISRYNYWEGSVEKNLHRPVKNIVRYIMDAGVNCMFHHL